MSEHVEVADDVLRSFYERWQRLEDEKQAISDDLKNLFAEAKGSGFDTKAMRAVFRDMTKDTAERQEAEAIYDLYWTSLSRGTRAYTREGKTSRAKTSEDNGRTSAAMGAPMTGEASRVDAGRTASATSEITDVTAGETALNSNPQPTSSPEAETPVPTILPAEAATGAEPSPSAPVDDFEPPAFLRKPERNERCQQPASCKFATHPQKITCSDCSTAWAISQRKAAAKEGAAA